MPIGSFPLSNEPYSYFHCVRTVCAREKRYCLLISFGEGSAETQSHKNLLARGPNQVRPSTPNKHKVVL